MRQRSAAGAPQASPSPGRAEAGPAAAKRPRGGGRARRPPLRSRPAGQSSAPSVPPRRSPCTLWGPQRRRPAEPDQQQRTGGWGRGAASAPPSPQPTRRAPPARRCYGRALRPGPRSGARRRARCYRESGWRGRGRRRGGAGQLARSASGSGRRHGPAAASCGALAARPPARPRQPPAGPRARESPASAVAEERWAPAARACRTARRRCAVRADSLRRRGLPAARQTATPAPAPPAPSAAARGALVEMGSGW